MHCSSQGRNLQKHQHSKIPMLKRKYRLPLNAVGKKITLAIKSNVGSSSIPKLQTYPNAEMTNLSIIQGSLFNGLQICLTLKQIALYWNRPAIHKCQHSQFQTGSDSPRLHQVVVFHMARGLCTGVTDWIWTFLLPNLCSASSYRPSPRAIVQDREHFLDTWSQREFG